MSGLWALAVLEVRTVLRDRAMLLMFAITIVFSGAVPPLAGWLAGPGEDPMTALLPQPAQPAPAAPSPKKSRPCSGELLPGLAVEGVLPDWVGWSQPLVPRDEADVVASVSVDQEGIVEISLAGAHEAADRDWVRRCMTRGIARERRDRLDALGLAEIPGRLLEVQLLEPPPPEVQLQLPPVSTFGLFLGALALMIAGSVAVEAVPRRRASGLLEQLRSTQTRSVELVAAWVLSITALTGLLLGASALAYLASAAALGAPEDLSAAAHVLPLGALVAAVSVRTSLRAMDVQSATLRWIGVLFLLIATSGLSVWWLHRPWLAALVPLGGSMVATSGVLGAWGWLADAAALGWVALAIAWSAVALDREDAASAGIDEALQRRASGNYLPEVLFFSGLGVSSAVFSGAGVFGGNLWLGLTTSFLLLLLLPSLLAPAVLGLPRHALLPLSPLRWRDLALSLPMTVGMVGLSSLVVGLTVLVVPSSDLIEQFSAQLEAALDGPLAKVAIGLYPAICEEFLYRGIVLGLLLRSGRPWLANVGQAALFAAAHVLSVRLPWTFVCGLILGWIRMRTGSLWATMALHFVFNVTQGLLISATVSESAPGGVGDLIWGLPLLLGLAVLPLYTRDPQRSLAGTGGNAE